jgi:peptide/nickel transport system permease protein
VIWRRVLSVVPLVVAASFLVFCLEVFLPGDPAVTLAGEGASPERIAQLRDDLDLDDPLLVRYGRWLGDAVQGDLGHSLFTRRPVGDEIVDRLGVTLSLVAGALVVAVVVGVPLGILAARRQGWVDRSTTLGATLGVAVPHFVIGIVLIVVFALWLDWFPTSRYAPLGDGVGEWLRHLALPVLALSAVVTAEVMRQLRSSLQQTLAEPYIVAARARGLPERSIVYRHALRVAASPVITVLSVQAARLFGAAVIVEQVFDLSGLGRLTVDAVLNRDLPVLQGVVPVAVVVAVLSALAADLAQMALNPRLRRVG